MLFTHLPDDLFRPLASPSRTFNAALLLHFRAAVFAEAAEPLRKGDVLAAIGEFCLDWTHPEIADDETTPIDPVERRSAVYRRFVETGWLIERRARYVPVVELDPDARLLLEDLARLDRGETRSYGGAVLDVLGALESATANPAERSQALANAAKASRDFLAHLRGLAGSMRKIEQRILSAADPSATFRLYFEDFVERHLVSDYRSLNTRFNPFRFRSGIVREAGRVLRDPLTLRALAEGVMREGRALDLPAAEQAVRADLAEILTVFEGLDRHLDAVAEVVTRLERRIAAALRHHGRQDSGGIERASAALRAIGAATDLSEAPEPPILSLRWPIGSPHLTSPRLRRSAIEAQPLPDLPTDPAIAAFAQAKDDFRRRTTITPERMRAFLDDLLRTRASVRASSIVVEDVDAFVVFQRLREVDMLFEGALAARYRVVREEGRVANGWLDCPDFSITRAGA